jgi:hypothetical protein
MTVHAFPRRGFLPRNAGLTVEIFRRLAKFREGYDEAILQELAEMLRRHMEEDEADQIMSDALALDNEIRFRLPCGLAVQDAGEGHAGAGEEALVTLIGHAEDGDAIMAVAMAERLGVENHHVLLELASALARSLKRGGIEIEWGSARAAMRMAACDGPARPGICR